MMRDQLIQLLVVDALEHAGDASRYLWLERVLEIGWRGFASMSDNELYTEARQRGVDVGEESLADNENIATTDDYDPELPELIASYAVAGTDLDFI